MNPPDTSTHETMIIWLLLAVILIGGLTLKYSLQKVFDNVVKNLDEHSQFNKMLMDEFVKLRERVIKVEDKQKYCKECPKD